NYRRASKLADCEVKKNLIWPDECIGACEVGLCLPTRMRRYLIFWTQPAECDCTPGHPATEDEHERLISDFPNLPRDGYTVTDKPDWAYNCIGWSRCTRTHGFMWPHPGLYTTAAERLDFFDRMYAAFGWRPASSCRSERGKRKIALYCIDGDPTHAAKQL